VCDAAASIGRGDASAPGSAWRVGVVASHGTLAAALRRGIVALGVERGLALAASFAGVEAVAVDADGRVHRRAGLAPTAAPEVHAA
jgi:thiamine biosynthesis lipoprotein